MKTKTTTEELEKIANPTTTLVMVGPEEANRMLLRNTHNRPLNERHVAWLQKEMTEGRWKFNGDTITFSKAGLVDGQHRLQAIANSGVKLRLIVVHDVGDDAFATKDLGRKRSAADVLAIIGEAESKRLSSTLQVVGRYEAKAMKNRGFILSPMQIEALLEKHPGVRDAVTKVKESGAPIMPFSVLAASYYLFSQKDAKLAEKVLLWLTTGAGMEEGSPILMLRDRLTTGRKAHTRLAGEYQMALLIVAWNALRSGKELKIIRWTSREEFPDIA